jgi:hypothetical protein
MVINFRKSERIYYCSPVSHKKDPLTSNAYSPAVWWGILFYIQVIYFFSNLPFKLFPNKL